MKYKKLLLGIALILLSNISFASGLLMPVSKEYPKDFLKLRSSQITINITGSIVETIVNEEFVNEWNDSTDAVYSFPLPGNARATKFLYWCDDKVYQAVLMVKEQASNPGTGEGGIAAKVNTYIGKNGIKILLTHIGGGKIQKVELHYVSQCDFYKGKFTYTYPLNAGDFITYPLENLQFSINVSSNYNITKFDIPGFSDYKIVKQLKDTLQLNLANPKAYIDKDFQFNYEIDHSNMGVDFYSVANDSEDGYFALFVRPQNQIADDSVLPKRIFFLLSNSSTMYGNNLSQSISAISQSLSLLSSKDYFNIVIFNSAIQLWNIKPVAANPVNIQNANDYLSAVSISWGSSMDLGIKECFNEIKDDSLSNIIIIFTNGRAYFDPKMIDSLNNYKAGIFPIGIGDDLDRSRMEMTAALNYGFVTYIEATDNLSEKMLRVFNQVNQPILKDVFIEYGKADLSQLVPSKIPSTYAGSNFFVAGRYKNPGISAISIGGNSVNGVTAYDFRLDFSNKKDENKFAETIWAKETIDAIERQIDVYGETPELKQNDITLSLKYNIRCKYTAYIADYTTLPSTSIEKNNSAVHISTSFITGNYPNPFNPATRIRFYLDKNASGKTKLLKIYNIIGQLVMVIDITNLHEGWNEVTFNGKNMYGNNLSSGIYLVQLQVGNKVCNTIRINLVK